MHFHTANLALWLLLLCPSLSLSSFVNTCHFPSDACAILEVPWIYSAILAFEGQLSVFQWKGGPDYRDLLPTPPPPGDVPSCAEGGVLGVLPGTMGCLQATEAIKMLLSDLGTKDHDEDDGVCSGRVLVFDALKMKFSEMGLEKDTEREPITELIDYKGFCGGPQTQQEPANTDSVASSSIGGRTMDEDETSLPVVNGEVPNTTFHSIEPKDVMDKLKDGWCPWVLDVRLPTEHDIVALPFTDRVAPHRTVRVHDVPHSGDVLVYCKAGVRGQKACDRLLEQGVDPQRLYNLKGGILRWQQDVDPSMPRY